MGNLCGGPAALDEEEEYDDFDPNVNFKAPSMNPRRTLALKALQRQSLFDAKVKKTKTQSRSAYDYMEVLGKGSFGAVLRVRNKESGDAKAIKIMDVRSNRDLLDMNSAKSMKLRKKAEKKEMKDPAPPTADDTEESKSPKRRRQSILREDKIMNVLKHPHIVRLSESFKTSHHLFLILELVPGITLEDMVKTKGAMLLEDTRKWSAQLILAVAYMHKVGIVHRDLKPDNIIISEATGSAKLLDFGLAFFFDSEKHDSTRQIGAEGYKAPEMLQAQRYGYSIDWWGVGILLYLMVFGQHPFSQRSGLGKMIGNKDSDVLANKLKFPSGADGEVVDLIKRLLVKNPAKRLGCSMTLEGDDIKFEDEPDMIMAHPFFESVDWDELLQQGERDLEKQQEFLRTKYGPDEVPQFDSYNSMMEFVDLADVTHQLEGIGM